MLLSGFGVPPMNRFSTVGWTSIGVVGVALIGVLNLPFLSEAAAPEADEETTSAVPDDTGAATAAVPMARAGISASTRQAADASSCQFEDESPHAARPLIERRDFEAADELLTALIDQPCLDDADDRNLARFQLAYLAHLREQPREALDYLDALESSIPVDDYALWLRGHALERLDRHADAAGAYEAIYDDETSPLYWKARARQAKSLVAAEAWEEALPVVDQIIDLFPDYPRLHRLLYYRGKVLENVGRLDDAAEAYQKAWFEFPYKDEGQRADERLDALASQGVTPETIDPEERYERYRRLSINKFWGLAHELLTDLRDEIRDPDTPPSELENEILQRIALNTFHRHDFEGAADYFAEARSIYEEGHEDGFSQRTIYRFHNFALARIGRFDEAEEALRAYHTDSSNRRRHRALGEFFERYARYDEAYDHFEQAYSRAQRRGWHFSYLKYKTGRFEEAYDSLRRLARRSRGETRAKYLYWAARSLERAGNFDEAAEVFVDIHQARPDGYYGLQAANRLLDIQQRTTVDETLLAQAEQIGQSADVVFDAFDQSDGPQVAGASNHPDPRTEPVGSALADESTNHRWGPALRAAVADADECEDDDCLPPGLGLPFPTYGLTWNLGQPLMDPRLQDAVQPVSTRPMADGSADAGDEAELPDRDIQFSDDTPRVRFNTDGRIYWRGRHDSDVEFVNYEQGEMIGPSPDRWDAYGEFSPSGAIDETTREAGELFPELERSYWLFYAGWNVEARRVIRDVALEFRTLDNRSRASGAPHELSHRRWAYLIDNRRRSDRADWWGMEPDDDLLRFPVPDDGDAKQELLERQQAIFDNRDELRPLLVDAFREVGDYHMVRRFALDDARWTRQSPRSDSVREQWKMAYPRAFPDLVIPLAEKHNINPYLIWSLMLVESSFNPDSISIADALGLLQVLPRTGLKIADLFGADDFGPFDLLEQEHSIEPGIFYFSRLVEKFHGQELLAFAGYNGGPHRVSGWLDMRGHQMPHDEFIEEIPFDQSRDYAKKTLRFLYTYLQLYEDYDEGLYVGQNLRTDYLPQPDF